jgi:hypothetical protein
VEGRWAYRECLIEFGRTILVAEEKLQQRLRLRCED